MTMPNDMPGATGAPASQSARAARPIRAARSGGGFRLRFAVALPALLLAVALPGPVGAGEPARSGAGRSERLTVRWNDAADTTRLLRGEPGRALRIAVCVTGADTLQGYTLQLRARPLEPGNAWGFAERGACAAAEWTATAEPDSEAAAPWKNKLSITDLKHFEDGTFRVLISTAFDLAALRPDSSYSLAHFDFFPPRARDHGACTGWDGPAQFYVEYAELLINDQVYAVEELGQGLAFEPVPGPREAKAARP